MIRRNRFDREFEELTGGDPAAHARTSLSSSLPLSVAPELSDPLQLETIPGTRPVRPAGGQWFTAGSMAALPSVSYALSIFSNDSLRRADGRYMATGYVVVGILDRQKHEKGGSRRLTRPSCSTVAKQNILFLPNDCAPPLFSASV